VRLTRCPTLNHYRILTPIRCQNRYLTHYPTLNHSHSHSHSHYRCPTPIHYLILTPTHCRNRCLTHYPTLNQNHSHSHYRCPILIHCRNHPIRLTDQEPSQFHNSSLGSVCR